MLVVITLVIPGWLGMAAVIYGFYQSEREHTVSGTIAVAPTLVTAVDRELLDTIRTAEFLAKSPLLESGDLAAFH